MIVTWQFFQAHVEPMLVVFSLIVAFVFRYLSLWIDIIGEFNQLIKIDQNLTRFLLRTSLSYNNPLYFYLHF
jgi:hypothetical protein